MQTLTFATIKGGVGKTTLSVNTAAGLADAGYRVLLLDLDPQAHASLVSGLESGDRPCVADALGPKPKKPLSEVIVAAPKRENLWIAPASLRMAALERELFSWGHRLQMLTRAYRTLPWAFDVCVIDTPPNIGAFTEAALAVSSLVIAPVPTGAFALQGLDEIKNAWTDVRDGTEGELVAVVNMLDRRTTATNDAVLEALRSVKVPVLKTQVPRSEAINQAGLAYEVLADTSKSALGADELRALSREVAQRMGLPRPAKKGAAHLQVAM